MELDEGGVMHLLRVGLTVGLAVAGSLGTAACGGNDEAGPVTTAPVPTTDATEPTTTVPVTTAPTTSAPAIEPTTTVAVTTETPTSATAAPTTEPVLVDVKVYLLRGERLAIAHREVPSPALLRGALDELLAGPTAAERDAALHSAIPDGTELRDVALADGLATVDLDETYESGGGSLSMTARVAQVVFTATQFENVDRVLFLLDGEPVDFLGGEGIVLAEPQRRMDVDRAFTGGILFDAPPPGTRVTSPFVVTGEGDVFEADFPLEVRRDSAPVQPPIIVGAGAWGEWEEFATTIDVDLAPGPIELVGWDEGGCGPPECPPPTEVVLPLTLVE
jgi:spore germination protein GerM